MPTSIWALEWLNANSQRNYPLTEDSTGQDVTGSFTLPDSFLLELDLPVHAGLDVDPSRFFLYQLGVFSNGFLIVVGYQPATGDPISVATAMVATAVHEPNNVYTLGGINDYSDTIGKVTVGRLDEINEQPSGLFIFTLTTARIDPDCVRPIVRGVSSLSVSTGTETSDLIYGDIELVADQNIQLTPIIVEGQNPQIRISAINGEGLSEPCVCIGAQAATPITSINDIPPTPDGNFTLLGSACLQITPIANGLTLNDICSQACCGCNELEVITAELEQFGNNAATLEGFVTRLNAEVGAMNMTVLGARLSDTGCQQPL